MYKFLTQWLRVAVIGLVVIAVPVLAQQPDSEPEPVLPESPNGRPMETVWDAAPGSVNGRINTTGPYRVSRWGDIVIRVGQKVIGSYRHYPLFNAVKTKTRQPKS